MTDLRPGTMSPQDEKKVWASISRRLRESLALGRDRFAKLLSVSPKTVWRWEKERVLPGPRQKEKLAFLFQYTKPQPITRSNIGGKEMSSFVVELFVRAVLSAVSKISGKVFDQVIERLMRTRIDREKKSPHVHADEDHRDLPEEWYALRRYVKEEEWQVVYDFGSLVLKNCKLPPHIAAKTLNWRGIAAFRLGRYDEARQLFNSALRNADEKERRRILSNLAFLHFRIGKLERAKDLARQSIEKDDSFDAGLYNCLMVACAEGSRGDCRRYFGLLQTYHPTEVEDPNSPLGRGLRSDPDLEFMREKMPRIRASLGLDDNRPKRVGSKRKSLPVSISLAWWLIQVVILILGLALIAGAGMTSSGGL